MSKITGQEYADRFSAVMISITAGLDELAALGESLSGNPEQARYAAINAVRRRCQTWDDGIAYVAEDIDVELVDKMLAVVRLVAEMEATDGTEPLGVRNV